MNKVLWVDDLRDPYKLTDYSHEECFWAKDYDQAIDYIEANPDINIICLDNDLGDENAPQGRDVLNLIEEKLFYQHFTKLEGISIHSDNASAVNYMMTAKDVFRDRYGVSMTRNIIPQSRYNT